MNARRRTSKKRSAASSRSRKPPDPTLFTDECLGRQVAEALRLKGATVITAREADLLGRSDPDVLAAVGQKQWIFLSKDQRIRRRPLELRALRAAGVQAFFLTSGNLSGADQANAFERALRKMLRLCHTWHGKSFVARLGPSGDVTLIEPRQKSK